MKTVFHIIMGFLFLLVMSLFFVEKNFYNMIGDQDDYLKANIYFKNSTLENEVETIQKLIQNEDVKASISFVNKEQSINDFSKTFAEYSRNLINLDDVKDLIPFVLEVKFSSEQLRVSTLEKIKTNSLIDEVTEPIQAYKKFYTINTITKSMLWLFFLISFLICLFMTMLLIRNVIYEDQEKISLLALFGKSYDGLVYEYIIHFSKFFIITVLTATIISYGLFSIGQIKLQEHQEFFYLGSKIKFLSISELFNLTMGFAVAYFVALYLVLKKSIKKSFRNL